MRLDTLLLVTAPIFVGCDSKQEDTSSERSSPETESDESDEPDESEGVTALTEICDGIDNDDDGRIDPGKLVAWYDGINDEFRLESTVGVTSIHMKKDGDVGFFGPPSPYDSEIYEWAIAAADGLLDAQSIEYFDDNGRRSVALEDSDGDGQVDKTAAYTYKADTDLLASFKLYYNSVFQLVRQDERAYTSSDTPDGKTHLSYESIWALMDWDGNFYRNECFSDFSPTSTYSDCRRRYSLYPEMNTRSEIQELWVGGVRRLQHRIGGGSPGTETLYDASGNTVLIRWGEAGAREVWTWDSADELTSRIVTSQDGEEMVSGIYYTHRDGLVETIEIDEDGDGEIDLLKTATHEDGRLTRYTESRFGEEISAYEEPPLPAMTIDYDASQSIRQIAYDWDGDGVGDVVYDYTISCEPAEHGFDPDNYDHDGDGYSVNDGDCDDENPNLTPDEGC